MKAQVKERARIEVSPDSLLIINDLIERGYYAGTRDLIAEALACLQVKLVNDTQSDLYDDEESLREMANLQLGRDE